MQQQREFRILDPRAPKFVPKRLDILNVRNKEFYDTLKEQYPELNIYTNLQINKIVDYFNNVIAQEVINNRNGVRLSEGLGIIVAGACKISKETASNNQDYNTSRKLGVSVPYNNLHSENYIAKVKYTNELDRHMFQNHDLWMFDACRNLSRAVATQFKNGNYKNYIVFTSRQHIAHLFRKQKIGKENVRLVTKRKEMLDNYDEFAFN